ncbi:putative SP-containing membrane protein [Vairimorpha necatrix]|uniref:SP-containing membrane protein n=1 Tax=Vairimorpha necatrix TaxID=6039 RepID=A0AAX4JCN9_9MICR
MWSLFLIQLVLSTTINVESNKKYIDLINSIIYNEEPCDSLEKRIQEKSLSENNIRILCEMVWNIITNHDIFKRMIKTDTSINSFNNKKTKLWQGYIDLILNKDVDSDLSNSFTTFEKKFIQELINSTTEYYDILRICFKDVLNSTNYTKDSLENIISINTCYIKNGIQRNIPSFFFKSCGDLIGHYTNCDRKELSNLIYNEDQLYIAECPYDDINFKIIGMENTNVSDVLEHINFEHLFNIKEEEETANLWSSMSIFIIILMLTGLIFMFLGLRYIKKSKKYNIKNKSHTSPI